MPAVLEIFNKDGSLRFSSERFKVIKFKGEVSITKDVQFVKENWGSWTFRIYLEIPGSAKPDFVFFPALNRVFIQTPHARKYVLQTYMYADSFEEVRRQCYRQAFIVGT